jgi:hypothetical protein
MIDSLLFSSGVSELIYKQGFKDGAITASIVLIVLYLILGRK